MAPELALSAIQAVPVGGVVLDPMVGSGTVVRQAAQLQRSALGVDSDPLAVLMTKVWTTPCDDAVVKEMAERVLHLAPTLSESELHLPWIDDDPQTLSYINYWFGAPQQSSLRRIAALLQSMSLSTNSVTELHSLDVLRLALSRIIVTKDAGASLARDVSHSRPHRVSLTSTYDVMPSFERSVNRILGILVDNPCNGDVDVRLGDARSLVHVKSESVDAVITSPPYLNAIDYIRGHRMSLVWLGYQVRTLRKIRSQSVGTERSRESTVEAKGRKSVEAAITRDAALSSRHLGMIARYAEDICSLMEEVARVLKPSGRCVMVVGNSCLKGSFIRNADGFALAGPLYGLTLANVVERPLPDGSRYLPIGGTSNEQLQRRMRTESVLSFERA
jgi:hypothetical protein